MFNIVTRVNGQIKNQKGRLSFLEKLYDIDWLNNPIHESFNDFWSKTESHLDLTPVEDGLVVVDFDTKWVGGLQAQIVLGALPPSFMKSKIRGSKEENMLLTLILKAQESGAIVDKSIDLNQPMLFRPIGWTFEHFEPYETQSFQQLAKLLLLKGFDITPFAQGWQDYVCHFLEITNEEDFWLPAPHYLDTFAENIIEEGRKLLEVEIPQTSKHKHKKNL